MSGHGERTREVLDALLAMAEAAVVTAADSPAGAADGEHLRAPASAAGGRLADLARRVLGCRHVAILAIDPESTALQPVAASGFSDEERERWWRQWDSRPALSDRLTPEHIARLEADETLLLDRTQPPFSSETALGRRMVLMAPLRMSAGLCGILSVDYAESAHTYSADEVALIRALGRLVAMVIERERLLDGWASARASSIALAEANRRMEEFLAAAGHELRTPLTSLLGNLQLALRWLDEVPPAPQAAVSGAPPAETRLPAVRTVLTRMERQTKLLTRLVQDVLDVVRMRSGPFPIDPVRCDLLALVREVVEEQRQLAAPRTILLDPGTPDAATVAADGERIAQVLTNYLTNALRYSDPDLPVTVGACLQDAPGSGTGCREARVWVRDQGIGLSKDEQELVWDRFYRSDAARRYSGSAAGMGLGLAICRGIIEQHNGRVGVESAPGQGSTFWFTLPLAESAAST